MKHILLLHGAIGAKSQLEPLADVLSKSCSIHLLNFAGHGGEPMPAAGLRMDQFVLSVLQYLDDKKIEKISIFGYSMGGYVALLFAEKYPQRVEKIITLASKFHWDEATAAMEIKMLQPAVIEEKIPAFAAELGKRHAPAVWKELMLQTQDLLRRLGQQNELSIENCRNVQAQCLLMLGDRDKMVTLEETVNVYKALPNASLAVLPETSHPIEKADLELVGFHVKKFLCPDENFKG